MRVALLFSLLCFYFFPSALLAGTLHDAAKKGDIAAITAALDGGSKIDEVDSIGKATALYYSVTAGHLEATRFLISRGADVNHVSNWGVPILNAAFKGHSEVLKLLLSNGANPNSAFKAETALHLAAEKGCLECVKILVEAGADVNALNRYREPPIHFAVKNGHSAVSDYLLENGYVVPIATPISARLPGADPLKGETLFMKQCKICHDATRSMLRYRGPPLWGIVGKPKAVFTDFKYSPALMALGGHWTYEALNSFLSDPARVLPGTDMGANGYQNEAERADLIAFLRILSDTPMPLPGN
jgi:cytochrome c